MRAIALSTLLTALFMLPAQAALAGFPNPANWTIPSHVTLVGLGPAGPDSATGNVICVIRDLANNPLPGSVVTFDFSACTDLTIATDQGDPRFFTSCPQHCVSAVTDVNGIARFTIVGAGTAGAAHPTNSLRVYADGVMAGSPSVAVLDRDGAAGLTSLDLSLWGADFITGTNPERADLDGSGIVNGADLSRWAAAYFNGRNVYSAAAYCP